MDKKVMYKLSYGLFVLTAVQNGKDNGCITNTAIQVTSEPNMISFAVNKANLTCEMLQKSKTFNLSIISNKADFDLFKRFGYQSGRDTDKFRDFDGYKRSSNGITYITEGTNSVISGTVKYSLDLGSHMLFVCDVTDLLMLTDDPSVTYEYYQENIKPKPEAVGKTSDGQTIWRCRICGYEYVGEDLPDDFICPICKHPASDFEKITG